MQVIKPLIRYATRQDWEANPAYPRLGDRVPRKARTEAILHHTVGVDTDATRNIWETDAECFAYMRRLQTIRPDLGLDVPYNYVCFLMRTSDGYPAILVCEGRGPNRDGAHTKYHNTTGVAVALAGDFENYGPVITPWAGLIGKFFGWLKYSQGVFNIFGMSNLGTERPSIWRHVFGHKDFASTACCGKNAFAALGLVKIVKP